MTGSNDKVTHCILCSKPLHYDSEFEDWVCEECELDFKFRDGGYYVVIDGKLAYKERNETARFKSNTD